jgi:hypothetical protein
MTSPYSASIWGVVPARKGMGARKKKKVKKRSSVFLGKGTKKL